MTAPEWWANGPEDDREADALEKARDEVMRDEDALNDIIAKVRSEFATSIDEICSGAWTVDGAQHIAKLMCLAADREIDTRARSIVDGWAEDRALSRAGL